MNVLIEKLAQAKIAVAALIAELGLNT